MCTSSAADDLALPEWMLAPDCPEWARDARYIDVDAVTALEIRRRFVDRATVNGRLSSRKYQARLRAARPPSVPADRMLDKLKAHVSMWRNHVARDEAATPGTMKAMRAALTIHSYRAKLAKAEEELRLYVESALRAEMARRE